MKNIVYRQNVEDRDVTWRLVQFAAEEATPEMLRASTLGFEHRLHMCENNNGGHFEQFL